MMISFFSTLSDSLKSIAVMTPLIGILISFCIFIASTIHTVFPASIISPRATLILVTIPANGAEIMPSGSPEDPFDPRFFDDSDD